MCGLILIVLLLGAANVNYTEANQLMSETCAKQIPENYLKDQLKIVNQCISLYLDLTESELNLEGPEKQDITNRTIQKYCKKLPQVNECLAIASRENLTSLEQQCFKETFAIMIDYQEFLCFENGDKLAIFITEWGSECIIEVLKNITGCFNPIVAPGTGPYSLAALAIYLSTTHDCEYFDKIHICVNAAFRSCTYYNTAAADTVDASFNFFQIACGSDEGVALKLFLCIVLCVFLFIVLCVCVYLCFLLKIKCSNRLITITIVDDFE